MQRLKTLYLKTRVIQLAPEIPSLMADMTQQPIEQYQNTDNLMNPSGFHQALFLSQCIKKWKINHNQFTPVEKHFYDSSVEQLNRFYDLHNFITQMKELSTNVYYLYLSLSNDQTAANITSYSKSTNDAIIKQLEETITDYNKLEKVLEAYPEWQSKLREDVGRYINLIYSLHIEDPELERILGCFDRHIYFK